ncbi:MAG: AAA family ATPase [Myxococcales bacterium]|nr:AAA family ATPase [Myxococcales bacterium]
MSRRTPPLFASVTLRDFLSYGPGAHTLALEPLNVLIGPNGSGKSNLVEALAVLRAVPGDLTLPIRRGGGVDDWLWRGPKVSASAELQAVFTAGVVSGAAVRYRIEFGSEGSSFVVLDERLEEAKAARGKKKPYFYFGYEGERPMLNNARAGGRQLERASIDRRQSVLSQRKDPENYPEVAGAAELLGQIQIYRSWSFGPDAPLRAACPADVRTDRLLEDFSNLPARLLALQRDPPTRRRLVALLGELAPGYDDYTVIPEGGALHLYVTEGERNVSAHRLSDGTLRYLCLLAILLDPGPARLVVIEEPELGLHPDVLPTLRDLMVEASARVQLVVTTHSTQLVDAMTDHADAVVVCEKHGPTTTLRRLDGEEVERWRQFGSLGSLWMSGQLGGTRW